MEENPAVWTFYRQKSFALGLILLLVFSACTPKASTSPKHSEKDDVKIDTCAIDQFGFGAVNLNITNSSSKTSDYITNINFYDSDSNVQVGNAAAITSAVSSHQSAKDSTSAPLTGKPKQIRCEITSVNRNATLN